ncbi:hypothetical protein ACFYKX_20310 [Cytobacillus sp. FJAT-54145]|uniref:IDEAL domain-containing protein n=1 Tax=Cytobacillus spartinae TaxID=3299023 RepID=A0ABW6KFA7_9BACI
MYHQNFIILKNFHYQVECYCPCSEHAQFLEFEKGDTLTITSEKKYLDGMGWFFLVEWNHNHRYFMSIKEIEAIYNDLKMCSFMDLELRTNYFNFKVNQSLDKGDREQFLFFSEQLSELKNLRKAYALTR